MDRPSPESENLTRSNDLKLVFMLIVALAVISSQFLPKNKSFFAKKPEVTQSAKTTAAR